MATKMIEWHSKESNEWEIMKWVYNYSSHSVYRYFKQDNGMVSKEQVL